MKRTILISAAIVLALAGMYGARALTEPAPIVTIRSQPVDPMELDRLIDVFSERADSNDFYRAKLGELYLDRAALTNSLDDYERTIALLEPVAVDHGVAPSLATAQLALHDFYDALDTIASLPVGFEGQATAKAIEFDALLGIGDLQAASRALDELEAIHHNEPAIIVRRAELAFFTGRSLAARDAAYRALDFAERASLGRRDMTVYLTAAARHAVHTGDHETAIDLAQRAIDADDRNPAAWLLASRATAAQGDLDRAILEAQRSVELVPDASALGFLADLHFASDEPEAAARQLEVVEAIASLDESATRRAVAQVRAEHGRSLEEALAAAQIELAERPDAYAHHLMATVLHQLDRAAEAEPHASRAISVADPMVWFRAGMIASTNGEAAVAAERLEHALSLSEHFHPIYADLARSELEKTGS